MTRPEANTTLLWKTNDRRMTKHGPPTTGKRFTPYAAILLSAGIVAACSGIDWLGTASRTVRNVCANAENCTVYEEGEAAPKDTLGPWDTKR